MGPKIEATKVEAKVEAKVAARPAEVNRKAKFHLGCIIFGIVLTVTVTWVPSDWMVIHFSGFFAGIPMAIQEIIDWIKKDMSAHLALAAQVIDPAIAGYLAGWWNTVRINHKTDTDDR